MTTGSSVLSRRAFLVSVAGGALALGFRLPATPRAGAQATPAADPAADGLSPNAWLTLLPSGEVVVRLHKAEMGQGVMTALPMLVAEELDADWRRVRVEDAYGNPAYGVFGQQFTFGSTSVSSSWRPLRQAGAAARAMLVAAAAARWGVDPALLRTEGGVVFDDAAGRSIPYADLLAEAAAIEPAADPPLKDPADFRLIGAPQPRLDAEAKATGRARYGIDAAAEVEGMLTAVTLRPPAFGGTVRAIDDAAALAVPGVRAVLRLPSPGPGVDEAVAVVADGFWPAWKGRQALSVEWDLGPRADLDSGAIRAGFEAVLAGRVPLAFASGRAERAIERAPKQFDATYFTPFLAHVAMEPMTAAAWVRDGEVDVWVGTQGQSFVTALAERLTGVPAQQVVLHQRFLGGGFGRRAESDVVGDALQASMAVGAPVLVVWPREEDIRHDFFRPATLHRVRAGIDSAGKPFAWFHQTAGDSAGVDRFPMFLGEGPEGDRIDRMLVSGLGEEFPYAVPHRRVESAIARSGVPVGFWRGVGETQNVFVAESAMDELALLAGADPVAFRRDNLADPRAAAVLDLAAERAGWGTPTEPGVGRGVALANYGGTWVACVAEAAVGEEGVRPLRLTVAVDCGTVVNPNIAAQQLEGGALFGLSAAMGEAVTLTAGAVEQGNVDRYRVLRFPDAPPVEVAFVPSDAPPSGLGEPAVVVVPPALANAVFAGTGERRRELPLG